MLFHSPRNNGESKKKQQKQRRQLDEQKAIDLLAGEGSQASIGYRHLGLNRALIKAVLKKLGANRRWQVNFANIVCATRYKYFNKQGEVLQVKCPNNCGQPDSLWHMIECYGLQIPTEHSTFPDKVHLLKKMAVRTAKNCPLLPMPIETAEAEGAEIELDSLATESSKIAQPPTDEDNATISSLGVSIVEALEFDGSISP